MSDRFRTVQLIPPARLNSMMPAFKTRVLGMVFASVLEGVVDVGERRLQLSAQAVDAGDDEAGYASCDQPIFDGGSARLVAGKPQNHGFQ